MLRAAREAFREDNIIRDALEALYMRHALLRPLVDMMHGAFDQKYAPPVNKRRTLT